MSAQTPTLGLFKHDPIQDAEQLFSIQQALNNNWDKLDTNSKEIKEYINTHIGETLDSIGNQITSHASAADTHNDIRLLIEGLTTRMNALANSDDTTLDQMKEVVNYIKANRELIESITTDKVSVSSIINNLTTNVSNKPLSAAQGVVLKAQLDELFQSVSEGKSLVAAAVTDKGINTAADATYATIAGNIAKIVTLAEKAAALTKAAAASQILTGYDTLNAAGTRVVGSMANRGAVTQALAAGGSYTIPAGYHNGSGKVTANTLASQTSATAAAAQILAGYTAWINGVKVTGTMVNRGAVSKTLNAGESYKIPAGYHNGSGKVNANSLESQSATTVIDWDPTVVEEDNQMLDLSGYTFNKATSPNTNGIDKAVTLSAGTYIILKKSYTHTILSGNGTTSTTVSSSGIKISDSSGNVLINDFESPAIKILMNTSFTLYLGTAWKKN